jgi:hypothetical protein
MVVPEGEVAERIGDVPDVAPWCCLRRGIGVMEVVLYVS